MENSLINVDALMNGGAIEVKEIVKNSDGYPTIRMHHAIQADLENPNCMHVHGISEEPVLLEKGYSMVTIASKGAVRHLEEGETTNFYKKWYGDIEKIKENIKDKESPGEGVAYLVALIPKDSKGAFLAEFETFNIYKDYWGFLTKANIGEKVKAVINIENHKENMVKSKTSKRMYHSPTKFKQYKIESLKKEEFELIKSLISNNIGGIQKWVEKKDNFSSSEEE